MSLNKYACDVADWDGRPAGIRALDGLPQKIAFSQHF
jgi:hypothetical protein